MENLGCKRWPPPPNNLWKLVPKGTWKFVRAGSPNFLGGGGDGVSGLGGIWDCENLCFLSFSWAGGWWCRVGGGIQWIWTVRTSFFVFLGGWGWVYGGFLIFCGANGTRFRGGKRGQNGKAVNCNSAELYHCKQHCFFGRGGCKNVTVEV